MINGYTIINALIDQKRFHFSEASNFFCHTWKKAAEIVEWVIWKLK